MSHFAKVENGLVTGVIVAEQDFIDSGIVGDPSSWIQTSYNTHHGIHYGPDGKPDGGVPLRKNYAGIGFTYDEKLDAFIPPKLYASWKFNQQTCDWEPPIEKPNDQKLYRWDEELVCWVEFEITN